MSSVTHDRHQIVLAYQLDGLWFRTVYWYGDVDLFELEGSIGHAMFEKLLFHIAAFDAIKFTSLGPANFDLGPLAHLHTERFERLWREVVRKVSAQWRYQHGLPDYRGPTLLSSPRASTPPCAAGRVATSGVLLFCGGGKDSLVAARLLDRAGTRYASLAYSSSAYGRATSQHALIDGLLDELAPRQRHKIWIQDDFLDSPVVELHPEFGSSSLIAAETPASIFAALPVVLAHGYRDLVLGHEASANTGNLVWDATGEDVNHQWGKSLKAERMLHDYIRSELVEHARYFSILQPIHDALIFYMLNRDLDAVPRTHSCNVSKPWCLRCAKCAYVWLGLMAYLPVSRVRAMIGENLFDMFENQEHFARMLGLRAHTPFECIGEIDEARLAFKLCAAKGVGGMAMEKLWPEVTTIDLDATLARYLSVDASTRTIPADLARAVLPQMQSAARDAVSYIDRTLAPGSPEARQQFSGLRLAKDP